MNILLNNKGNVYEQIVNHFKKYIELEIYKNGEKLPSCRELATSLGVNPNTVSKAYSKLEDDGYIIAIAKKGIYVQYNGGNNTQLITEIQSLKNSGYTYDEMIKAIREVYNHD